MPNNNGEESMTIAEDDTHSHTDRHRSAVADGTRNGVAVTGPQEQGVHQLFAAQAARTPDAVAVVGGDQRLTYRELDRRANQLAHHLRACGVGADVVGLCLERSIDFIVGALGILKAGGAYLPLDPSHPAERLHFMLADARVPVLVTRQSIAERLVAGSWRTVAVDAEQAEIDAMPTHVPEGAATGDDLSYVIYTSGSTGEPKGVELTHRSLLNLVSWHREAFAVTAADRATQIASLAFDAAVWELWPYLTAGASIHLPDEATRLSPESLRDWLVAQQITLCFLPTPLAEIVDDVGVAGDDRPPGDADGRRPATQLSARQPTVRAHQ